VYCHGQQMAQASGRCAGDLPEACSLSIPQETAQSCGIDLVDKEAKYGILFRRCSAVDIVG